MHSNSIPMTRDALFHASMHHDFAVTTWQSVADIHAVMFCRGEDLWSGCGCFWFFHNRVVFLWY